MKPATRPFCLTALLLASIASPANAQAMFAAIEQTVATVDESGAEYLRKRPVLPAIDAQNQIEKTELAQPVPE